MNIVTAGSSLNDTDAGVTNGQSYFYVVTALNANGEGAVSTEVSATPHGPPTLSVTASADILTLSWPGWAGTFAVYMTTNLNPPVSWQPWTNGIQSNSGGFNLLLPTTNAAAQFFQLRWP